jgi:hypothetical protein
LRPTEAKRFKTHFKDLFNGKYVFSGRYQTTRRGVKYPLYWVVWIPPKYLPYINGFEMSVDRRELLTIIPMREKRQRVTV